MHKLPIIISASRMTDMPAFYPQNIISEIEARKSRGLKIHTIVLWTKHVASIFREPLHTYLKEQQLPGTQIYVQLTVTGIGKNCTVKGKNNTNVYLEPCVPDLTDSISQTDRLIDFLGTPDRIRLRVDPLVQLKDANGNIFSNYDKLFEIISLLQPKGIRNYSFSFLEKGVYRKVDSRFTNRSLEILSPNTEERLDFYSKTTQYSRNLKVSISACSVEGLPQSACIDGELLQNLHPQQWPVDLTQPHSRELCGCTKSIDIGGWPPKECNSGCLYCYSRPKLF